MVLWKRLSNKQGEKNNVRLEKNKKEKFEENKRGDKKENNDRKERKD